MHRNTLRTRMWVSLGDNYSVYHRHNTSISIFHFFRSKTPMLLPKAGNITAQSRDHVAQFPLLCLTWLNSTMWWKWKWYVQLLEAALKREGVSFPFFLSFLLAKTHTWGMKLDQALWNMTEKVHNEDDRVMGDCVPMDCELSHWPYVINASGGEVGGGVGWGRGGINIYLLSFSYQAVWMLNQTCSHQIHRMQNAANPKYRKRDKWKGNEKKGFEISPGFGQLKKKSWVWKKQNKTSRGKCNWRDTTEEQGSNEVTLGGPLINVSLCKLCRS